MGKTTQKLRNAKSFLTPSKTKPHTIKSHNDINVSKILNKRPLTALIATVVVGGALAAIPLSKINNIEAATSNVTWPTSGNWTTETIINPTANIVKTAAEISLTKPAPTESLTPEVIATGLDTPWSMRFAPDGRLFVAERPGRVRVIQNKILNPTPVLTIAGTETLSAEEGLQGMALDPDFSQNGYMYVYYTFDPGDGSMKNRVSRYTIVGNTVSGSPTILVDNIPGSRFHNGGRIAFGPDGKLYIATGSADSDAAAQDLASTAGKILRINSDGSFPLDNPFPNSPVYSFGHRNPQGLAWHPTTGELWSTEHGPTGTPPFCCHDEVNIIKPGLNYGWPKYYGTLVNPSYSTLDVTNPVYPVFQSDDGKWAPGGTIFYTGDQLGGAWKNSLIYAGLGFQNAGGRSLYRLQLGADNQTPGQLDTFFTNQFGRLRDVVQGPEGELYLATSNRDGRGQPIAEDDRIVKLNPTFAPEVSTASFTMRFDAGANINADWQTISSSSAIPTGTNITYESRSSADNVTYTAFAPGVDTTPNGRYIEVKVNLASQRANIAPAITSVTLSYEPVAIPVNTFCSGTTAHICEDFSASASNFTTTGGTWAVNGGKYSLTGPATSGSGVFNRAINSKSVTGDYTLSAKLTPTASSSTANDVALIFGYQNSTNYWSVSLAENNSTGNHGIFKVVNGTVSQVLDFSSTYQLADGTTYDVKLIKTGTNLKIFRNNVQIANTTQTTPATGNVGLGSINDAASFDELLLTLAATAPPPPPPPPVESFCNGSTASICEDFSASASNFTTTGGTWAVNGGKYVLSSPATSGNGPTNNRSVHSTAIGSDFTLKAKVTPTPSSSAANDIAIIFGYTNSTNYWTISLAENNSTGNHGIFKIVNNAWTQAVDFTSGGQLIDGTTYDVRLERAGTTIRVYVNNVLISTSTPAGLPATGQVGFGSINDAASFDELTVTQP